jgi:hypothetical protein
MFEIIGRVDHDGQIVTDHRGQTIGELGTSRTTGKRWNHRHHPLPEHIHLLGANEFGRAALAPLVGEAADVHHGSALGRLPHH